MEFRIFFWAADISTTLELKSRILADIHQAFIDSGIAIPSTKKDLYLHFPDGEPLLKQETKATEEKKSVKKDTNKNDPDQDQ